MKTVRSVRHEIVHSNLPKDVKNDFLKVLHGISDAQEQLGKIQDTLHEKLHLKYFYLSEKSKLKNNYTKTDNGIHYLISSVSEMVKAIKANGGKTPGYAYDEHISKVWFQEAKEAMKKIKEYPKATDPRFFGWVHYRDREEEWGDMLNNFERWVRAEINCEHCDNEQWTKIDSPYSYAKAYHVRVNSRKYWDLP